MLFKSLILTYTQFLFFGFNNLRKDCITLIESFQTIKVPWSIDDRCIFCRKDGFSQIYLMDYYIKKMRKTNRLWNWLYGKSLYFVILFESHIQKKILWLKTESIFWAKNSELNSPVNEKLLVWQIKYLPNLSN